MLKEHGFTDVFTDFRVRNNIPFVFALYHKIRDIFAQNSSLLIQSSKKWLIKELLGIRESAGIELE